ncbi:GNAT family protein [Anaerotignum sp.]|uniref:GNAT family N-acetyltransferase n=1 Tax=Anaerotignum sp. TaxID=2039241 RepID=UPI0033205CD1
MKLRPYKNEDAKHIVGWIKDETAYYQWCAGLFGEYPLSEKKIIEFYEALQNNTSYWGMTAEDELGVMGHISMRFVDEKKRVVRLGFVLVDVNRRGQGLGKELVSLGIAYARLFLEANRVTLGVFEQNAVAKKCYESLGFVQDQESVIKYKVKEQEWNCLEMVLNP